MTEQQNPQPGEAEFAEAWPSLRERWISHGLSIEQLVRAAYLAGFAARKAQLMRLAYSPEGLKEIADERFRAPARHLAPPRTPSTGQYFNPDEMPAPPPVDWARKDRRYGPDSFISAPASPDPDETLRFGSPGTAPSTVEDDNGS